MTSTGENIPTRIVVVLLALILAACAPAATATRTSPPPANTPVPTEMPTEAPANTATPGPSFLKVPGGLCCRGITLEPGKYEMASWLSIPLSMELGEDWRGINEKDALLFALVRGRNSLNDAIQWLLFIHPESGSSPEELLQPLKNARELISETELLPVTVAQYSGLQVDLSAKPNPDYAGDPNEGIPAGVQFLPSINKYFTPGFLWTTSSAEARLRIIALNVGEETLLIYLEAPPDEFETFIAEVEKVLQSLELIGT